MKKDGSYGELATMSALAFTAGFVDTLSFIALYGLFAAHITGNFVLIATSLAEFRHGLWIKLLAVPAFFIAAVLTRIYIIRRERNSLDAASHVLLGQSAVLAILMAVGVAHSPFGHHEHPGTILTGLLAAAAMAIQNTAARTFLSSLPPTTVMTGNMIQVIVDSVDLLHRHGDLAAKRTRLAKLGPMLLAFVGGTLLGAVGYTAAGFYALLVPIIAIAILSIRLKPRTVHA